MSMKMGARDELWTMKAEVMEKGWSEGEVNTYGGIMQDDLALAHPLQLQR